VVSVELFDVRTCERDKTTKEVSPNIIHAVLVASLQVNTCNTRHQQDHQANAGMSGMLEFSLAADQIGRQSNQHHYFM
jgi:hypothetical protein